jgi:hypothetical protein
MFGNKVKEKSRKSWSFLGDEVKRKRWKVTERLRKSWGKVFVAFRECWEENRWKTGDLKTLFKS